MGPPCVGHRARRPACAVSRTATGDFPDMTPPITFTNTVRYSTLALCVLVFVLSLFALIAFGRGLPWFVLSGALVALTSTIPTHSLPILEW